MRRAISLEAAPWLAGLAALLWCALGRVAWACSSCSYGAARRQSLYTEATLIMLLPTLGLVAALAIGLWTAMRDRKEPDPVARALVALRDYLTLTKPSILLLVLVTGLPAAILAGGDPVDLETAIAALAGTALAAASAGALNHYLDRDIDALMVRTMRRPLPAGRLRPAAALVFGLLLAAAAAAVLLVWTTPLAAALAIGSVLYYTLIYTSWLKRRTPQSTVIGGVAGASAPLIVWAAMTGRIDLPAWIMFMIVFLWTPPHFWALAIFRKDDYARAGVPLLPAVKGDRATRRGILLYALLTVPLTLALYFTRSAGALYLVAAVLLGARFAWQAWGVWRGGDLRSCVSLFKFSIVYLLAIFLALTADAAAQP